MVYSDYMTNTCVIRKNLGVDEDTLTIKWGEPESKRCFYYGETRYLRDKDGYGMVNGKHYLMDTKVSIGDMVDNQVVKVVDNIPEFDGSEALYDVITWN